MASCLKLMCMNVRGLADKRKRIDVLQWLTKKNASIYCLTDIHISTDKHNALLQEWGNGGIINSHSSDSRGGGGVYVPFNSQGHIGTGPQNCHLWDSNPQR